MLIQVESLSKRYGGLQAIRDVSLVAKSGEVTSVIGPNGAGKSTLINCMTGMVAFNSGRIVIDGVPHASVRRGQAVELGITRTFQNIRVFESLTVEEHVLLARRSFEWTRRGRSARGGSRSEAARGFLARVGLADKARLRPSELSYGERRHLEIARGLATQPRLMLLDEPAAGSTLSEQAKLARIMRDIAASGVAVVLVEHHMNVVADVSTSVVVLNFGEVILTGTIDDVRRDPQVVAVYLGVSP